MNPRTQRVFVAAGSNIEPVHHLKLALTELERRFGALQVSPAYRNQAVGFSGEDFINLVVGFDTDQDVHWVRERLQEVEGLCGRPREAPKWAPRSMDLDILLFGDQIRDELGLVLPRPDLVRRAYMLKPLVDIAPDLIHPTLHKRMDVIWAESAGQDHELVAVDL